MEEKQDNRIFVILPVDLKRDAKVKAVRENTTVSRVVRTMIEQWVKGEANAPEAQLDVAKGDSDKQS